MGTILGAAPGIQTVKKFHKQMGVTSIARSRLRQFKFIPSAQRKSARSNAGTAQMVIAWLFREQTLNRDVYGNSLFKR